MPTNTQTSWKERYTRFIGKYRTAETLTLVLALGLMTTMQHDVPYQAHFIQRIPVHVASSSSRAVAMHSISSTQKSSTASAHKRLAKKIVKLAMDTTRTIDAEKIPSSVRTHTSSSAKANQVMHGAAPTVQQTTEASSASTVANATFPAFSRAVQPVNRVPNWGAMTKPEEWNRRYNELNDEDFVRVPPYDMNTLTIPMVDLLKDRFNAETIRIITAKLYYSTRFFGKYDIDAVEFTAVHPGIDLKLAEGTPIGAIAGGRVHAIRTDEESLGLHAIIEHRAPDGETYYSIYGHMSSAAVKAGDTVVPGQTIGYVGMTGHTTGPHIHLQVDRGEPSELFHEVYSPASIPSQDEAEKHTINPIDFIRQFADGE
jgi:murein DD-endopeptidase MepM/ murein hydrolase activator NlpD